MTTDTTTAIRVYEVDGVKFEDGPVLYIQSHPTDPLMAVVRIGNLSYTVLTEDLHTGVQNAGA